MTGDCYVFLELLRCSVDGKHFMRFQSETWGPFLESSGNFSGPDSLSKISNLTITKLLYSRILNMNGGSLHLRKFQAYTTLRF